MGLKCLATVLCFSHCLSFAFSVSREFPGNGYLKYDIVGKAGNKPINSNKNELRVRFKTIQPSGLLFYTQTSGGELGDYLMLELCGGRICVGMKLGGRNGDDNKKTEILGRDLSNGQVHKVLVKHNNFITTIVLNEGTSDEERREIKTVYRKLEVDIVIYVGGAPSFQNLQGVKSNTPFMGCLTDVEFKHEGMTEPIKFLVKGVTDPVNVDMNKECPPASSYEPYTFDGSDSSFTFQVKKSAKMTGSFKFRSYKKSGTLLEQVNGRNGFTISYRERYIGLNVKIGNTYTDVALTFGANEQKVNSGNWHTVEYNIGASSFSLTIDNKTPSTKAPSVTFPTDFFGTQAIAGSFTGCMRDLKVNNEEKKPFKGVSAIKNVETDSCNITDLCIFSPCMNKGSCSQDGRTFTCDCSITGYKAPMCQFPEATQNCEQLKKIIGKDNAKDGNWTLDLDGPGPLKPISGIYCNMTADPPITVVYSEDKGVKVITDKNTGTIVQPYIADIRYYPSLDFAKALAMNSANCKQFIEFGCKNAKLLNAGEKYRLANWISAGGVYQDYWGGAPPNSESCACGVNNTCLPDKKKKCNCDARSNSWTKDEGFLTATADLPVTQVVFRDVNQLKGSEANFTVGNLHCSGNISNTATFVNENGMIRLDKWTPPSHGVISLFFKTPYLKGVILSSGFKSKEFFKLFIINGTSVGLEYNIGNGYQRVELSLKGNKEVNDRQWHEVVIYRNMKLFGLKLDTEERVNLNPLFLERDLDLEDDLHVGGDPSDVRVGFVGCIRGLTINGGVIDLNKKAESADYVQGGCGATYAGPRVCHACTENEEDPGAVGTQCIANQLSQMCATDPNSLGTTHCGSVVGTYRNALGNVHTVAIRGCIDCADKKAACFAVGGALKVWKNWFLLKCEMECCTDSNCNTQTPTLKPAAITVFTPDDAGTRHCYSCVGRDESTCRVDHRFRETCATSHFSLGTTHCGSAVVKYQDKFGKVSDGFIRGCIQCSDKRAACFALGGYLKVRKLWTVLKCEIECCTGNDCNTQTPTLSRNATTVFTSDGSSCHQVLFSTRVLALAVAFGNILYHLC